jgi:hypothetical protein
MPYIISCVFGIKSAFRRDEAAFGISNISVCVSDMGYKSPARLLEGVLIVKY